MNIVHTLIAGLAFAAVSATSALACPAHGYVTYKTEDYSVPAGAYGDYAYDDGYGYGYSGYYPSYPYYGYGLRRAGRYWRHNRWHDNHGGWNGRPRVGHHGYYRGGRYGGGYGVRRARFR